MLPETPPRLSSEHRQQPYPKSKTQPQTKVTPPTKIIPPSSAINLSPKTQPNPRYPGVNHTLIPQHRSRSQPNYPGTGHLGLLRPMLPNPLHAGAYAKMMTTTPYGEGPSPQESGMGIQQSRTLPFTILREELRTGSPRPGTRDRFTQGTTYHQHHSQQPYIQT